MMKLYFDFLIIGLYGENKTLLISCYHDPITQKAEYLKYSKLIAAASGMTLEELKASEELKKQLQKEGEMHKSETAQVSGNHLETQAKIIEEINNIRLALEKSPYRTQCKTIYFAADLNLGTGDKLPLLCLHDNTISQALAEFADDIVPYLILSSSTEDFVKLGIQMGTEKNLKGAVIKSKDNKGSSQSFEPHSPLLAKILTPASQAVKNILAAVANTTEEASKTLSKVEKHRSLELTEKQSDKDTLSNRDEITQITTETSYLKLS